MRSGSGGKGRGGAWGGGGAGADDDASKKKSDGRSGNDGGVTTLSGHSDEVNAIKWSPTGRLLASASDDGTVHVFHARVFADYATNPVIVPVKILRGHEVGSDGLGVLDAAFHPTQPWLFTCGADGGIVLWQNLP